jgi:hypothetical protein
MAATTAAVVATAATAASAAYSMSGAGTPDSPVYNPNMGIRAYKKGVALESQLLPIKLASELDARRRYDPLYMQHEQEMQAQSAAGTSRTALANAKEFAPQFIDANEALLEQANPEGVSLRKKLMDTVSSELDAGRGLTQTEQGEVQRTVRGAQAARGNILGNAAAFEEAIALKRAGDNILEKRLGNAFSALSLRPQDMWAGLQSPFAPQPSTQAGFRLFNTNVGQQVMAGANQNYATDSGIYSSQLNAPNPWMQGLGMIAGAAGQVYRMNTATPGTPQPKI